MRDVSCSERHYGRVEHWSKPDARRQPQHDRGGDTRKYARAPAALGRGFAAVQTRQQDAGEQSFRSGLTSGGRLFAEFEMKYGATQITDEELAAQMEREKEELERTWAPPRGLRGWFTDTDHKAIAIRYIVTAFVFFV